MCFFSLNKAAISEMWLLLNKAQPFFVLAMLLLNTHTHLQSFHFQMYPDNECLSWIAGRYLPLEIEIWLNGNTKSHPLICVMLNDLATTELLAGQSRRTSTMTGSAATAKNGYRKINFAKSEALRVARLSWSFQDQSDICVTDVKSIYSFVFYFNSPKNHRIKWLAEPAKCCERPVLLCEIQDVYCSSHVVWFTALHSVHESTLACILHTQHQFTHF